MRRMQEDCQPCWQLVSGVLGLASTFLNDLGTIFNVVLLLGGTCIHFLNADGKP